MNEEITSEENASEEATGEGNTFEDTTSEETAIEETTSGDTTSEEGSSDTLTSAENNTNTDTGSSTYSSILSPINSSAEIIIDYSLYSSSQAYTSSELHPTYSPALAQYPTDSENNGHPVDTTHSRQQTKTRSAEKTGIYSTNGSYAADSGATSSKSYATDDAQTETPASSVDKTSPYTTETYPEKTSASVYTPIPAPDYNTSDHRNGNHHHPRCQSRK
ncbi:hypothetical protein IWW45_007512 [Coemansia sp. RSA 485]|nr:hypothetical protein IWW45_007512 [Coemansia sp. RSA 485]